MKLGWYLLALTRILIVAITWLPVGAHIQRSLYYGAPSTAMLKQ